MEVNTIAPIESDKKAFKPLLRNITTPKFFVITAHPWFNPDMENLPFPTFAYGAIGAANYLFEDPFENLG